VPSGFVAYSFAISFSRSLRSGIHALGLGVESLDCFSHIATQEVLHHIFECRVFCRTISSSAQSRSLLLGVADTVGRLDRFMLSRVAY